MLAYNALCYPMLNCCSLSYVVVAYTLSFPSLRYAIVPYTTLPSLSYVVLALLAYTTLF